MKKLLTFLTLLTLSIGVGWAATETNELTISKTGATGSTYTDWTYSFENGVSYSGNSANKNDVAIQLRSNNNNSGIVSTTSIGTIKKVVVSWYSETSSGRTLDIYGKNSAYSSPSDLYGSTSTQGTKLGSIVKGTSTELTVDGSYAYIGLRSNNGAMYITSITITWEVGGTTVETVATPTFDPAEGTFTEAQNVTISCATSGATIYYTTDGSAPTTSSSTYSSAIPVSETTTIKAMGVKSDMNNSDVATATYTINIPQPSSEARFERINSTSQLEAGKRYILVYETTPAGMGAISTTSTKYGISETGSSNLTVTNGVATLPSGSAVKPLTLGGNATDGWTFDLDGALLNHTGTKNTLTTGTSNTTWTIAFSGNNATITNKTNTTRVIKYNSTSGQERFACYESGQQAIQLYKEVESTTSNKLYLIGQDMNSQSGWNLSTGPEFTYSNSAGTYAVDAYFDMADRCYFQFVDGLSDSNSNWGGLTGRYYAAGNGDVAVDTYDMDGTVPLGFTNDTQYSPGQYAFSVPAGIYTIVVDKPNWKIYVTQHEVTMTISPNSATFETTKNVTMASNLTERGGKIYYTTDGSDPRDQYSTRQEYTDQLTISATTTFKAVAVLNCIYSDVVEKTYTKAPAAPVISPASCTFNEPLTVSITAESGATIYYTTDGSTPTNESTQYTGSFTVSTTTTVKARAYVGEAYSNIAEATYTYSNVQPSTGDFTLVTEASQLVAGNEYIILAKYNGTNYAMGTISGNKGQSTNDFTLDGTIGVSGSTIAAGTAVNVFTLEASDSNWKFKLSDNSYIEMPSSTNITTGNSGTAMTITLDNNLAEIVGTATPTRLILFSSSNSVFGNYASSNAGASGYSSGVYLYTRATNAVQNPVFSPVPGIYNVDIAVTISCATDGATIYYTTDGTDPTATTGTEYTGEMVVSESTTFKAIAVKDGNTSSVVTAAYTINKNTEIATVTLTYSEPFTAGIGDFTIDNVSGFSPVWSLDGNYGVKGTSYSNGTNYAATSRLISPIIDMTGSVLPSLTFSHQINKYFNDVTSQCKVFIRETSNGTSGTWKQIPITFSDPVAAGGWTNDIAVVDLTDVNGVSYADKKVQISFLYTNPTEGSGAGTWEIQNFVVEDLSEYRMVNNIAEFLALDNGITAKFKNPVTVLYDYAQYSSSQYHEYIWVKDESGYMQFYMVPTLNSDENSGKDGKAAYYENGDIIPAGFVVTKNYYEYGKYVQAYTNDALNAGFEQATQKGLADPEHMDFDVLHGLDATNQDNIDTWCNRYIVLEKIKITSKSGKNFSFANESSTVNHCVGYNKYNGDGSLLKDGSTSADVTLPAAGNTYYNVTGIIQLWQGGWEFMPIEFTEWKADEVTLRKLCADGVETHEYKISNNLMGVYASADGTKLWVKDDDGQSIWEVEPDATYKDNFPIEADGNTRLDQAHYDQSNWCEIQLTAENASDFVGKIINGGSIQGTFSNKTNPTMTGVTLTNDDIYSAGSYAPNYYMPANFYGNQPCWTSQHGQEGHGNYFFMTPKPQEYAQIVWAIWDSENEKMVITEDPKYNSHEFKGSFSINLNMNSGITDTDALHDGMDDGFAYNFCAIIRVNSSKAGSDLMVYPVDLTSPTDPATAINKVETGNGVVKSVKYVNVAGMVSDTPFQGVNIVITEYTDGTRTATKMLNR